MTSIVRRVAGVFVVVCVVGVGACSSSSKKTIPTASTTTSTTAAPATTTTTRQSALETAIWPTTTGRVRYQRPVVAARSFATSYLHFVSPVVGAFQQGDARSGEVPIRPFAGGPVTTVVVRQLGTDNSWWVLGAATDHIRITEPAALATITSPVTLRGTSTAFEATVQVSIRQDDSSTALVESFLMGGSNGEMGPFDATFNFAPPTSRSGGIVLYNTSSADGHVVEATAIRVGFPPT